jgi:DNA repair protein RadA/Sms
MKRNCLSCLVSKSFNRFQCEVCHKFYIKWSGFCHACQNWNSIEPEKKQTAQFKIDDFRLENISDSSDLMTSTGWDLFDRTLGGGINKGATFLIYGEPGAGKSSFISNLLKSNYISVYISGEETIEKVAQRCRMHGCHPQNTIIINQTELLEVKSILPRIMPDIVVVDSIQTMTKDGKAATSIATLKEITSELIDIARQTGIMMYIIGHVNKGGQLAGPKHLEHMVDIVMGLKLTQKQNIRLLSLTKNRFGTTSSRLFLELSPRGLLPIET